jgi:thioesterase domain-containing protein
MTAALVTGLGVAAPNGLGTEEYWSATLAGRTGIGRITRFDPERYPVRLAGEVPGFAAAEAIQPVYGIQASGLTGTAPPSRTMDQMVDRYLTAIKGVRPTGPYRLLGWSFGGLVAHALAARLQERGERVEFLAMLDTYPRIPPRLRHAGTEAELLADLMHIINVPSDEAVTGPIDRSAVLGTARREGSALASLDDATIERIVAVFGANYEILRSHVPRRISGDAHLFTAVRGDRNGLSATAWRSFVEGEVHEYEVDCEHRDMGRAAPMAQIGSTVRDLLAPLD